MMGRWGLVFAIALLPALQAVSAHAAPQAGSYSQTSLRCSADLQGFFDLLQDARTREEAHKIETDILRRMAQSDSPTIDLLIGRALSAEQTGDLATARELLNQSIALAPDYAEGWRKRGEIAALRRDYADAIDDLSQAVKLQPRHFLALESLGKLHEASQDREAAIGFYQSALALDPWLDNAKAGLKRLGLSQSQIGAVSSVKPGAKAAAATPAGKGGV